MISRLKGKILARATEEVVVEAGGVGYGVMVPLSTYCRLPEVGEEIELFIHTQLRPESIQLFGFLSPEERKTFGLLINIPDIGPRMAINVLSGIPWDELSLAVQARDTQRIQAIPRIGKKIAERIVLELQGKLPVAAQTGERSGPVSGEGEEIRRDAIQALVNLGYGRPLAEKTVKEAMESEPAGFRIENILKKSLKRLVR
jgi:Holliday junction DNA helicase RuvA